MSEIRIDPEKIFYEHPFARSILTKLEAAGFEAVLIGGIVRDAVRDQIDPEYEFDPIEVDVATSARPEEIKKVFKGYTLVEVGEAFGVLKIISDDGIPYEVATYRVESEYDGRWPGKVELVRNLEGDVKRRDLTVNGLAADGHGRVIDFVGGLHDLKEKNIRTIGEPDERFREDFLRILRAIRLTCALDGKLLPEVSAAIRRNREGLLQISSERIRDELFRLLGTQHSTRGIRLMDEHGVLELILPELSNCKGVPQPEKYHPEGDVYTHTLLALEVADRILRGPDSPLVKFSLLLHDVGKPVALQNNHGEHAGGHEVLGERMAIEVGKRLRLSNDEIEMLRFTVREHLRIAKLPEMGVGKQVKYIKSTERAAEPISDLHRRFTLFAQLLQLMVCDCEASAHKSSGWLPVVKTFVERLPQIQHLDELERARKLLDGHDLLAMGMKPGPPVKRVLEAVYEKIHSGQIKSRAAALEAARVLVQAELSSPQ
ncbi:CCA tRNA nucleotidyltransferase [Candidatus Acetothermia bacterium]|nr:CCA tRNA nucleotidyltransferase [Candidatus Acetothermia bacterium]